MKNQLIRMNDNEVRKIIRIKIKVNAVCGVEGEIKWKK